MIREHCTGTTCSACSLCQATDTSDEIGVEVGEKSFSGDSHASSEEDSLEPETSAVEEDVESNENVAEQDEDVVKKIDGWFRIYDTFTSMTKKAFWETSGRLAAARRRRRGKDFSC